jgi:ATP adenylyltransferase
MEILFSPWRTKYIHSFKDEAEKPAPLCFFCEYSNAPTSKDAENLIVARFPLCFAMLNRFPYNSGHVLIAPYRHIGDINELSDEEMAEMFRVCRIATNVITAVNKPHGYNIGMNLGRVSGAGVPDHLHIHVVPRWNGDTSFISVISDIKVVSEALEVTQAAFSKEFLKYT